MQKNCYCKEVIMECQDCGRKRATTIIFSMEHLLFYAVCDECIGKDDYILGDGLLKKFAEDINYGNKTDNSI